jgi:hypothetical protein
VRLYKGLQPIIHVVSAADLTLRMRASGIRVSCNGFVFRRQKVYSRVRLISNVVVAYVPNIDLACRTLSLAKTAPSAIFLSKST